MVFLDEMTSLTREQFETISTALEKASGTLSECSEQMAKADRYASALRAIIERADNGELGTSKVKDMRKLAQEALK